MAKNEAHHPHRRLPPSSREHNTCNVMNKQTLLGVFPKRKNNIIDQLIRGGALFSPSSSPLSQPAVTKNKIVYLSRSMEPIDDAPESGHNPSYINHLRESNHLSRDNGEDNNKISAARQIQTHSRSKSGDRHMDIQTDDGIIHTVAKVTVYTDGACTNNGKKSGVFAGVGAFFGEGDSRNFGLPLDRRLLDQHGARSSKPTNQSAELLACKMAIERILFLPPSSSSSSSSSSSTTPRQIKENTTFNITIKTDSEYTVKAMNSWARAWERNGWKTRDNKPVLNLELMQALYSYKKRLGVHFVHVRAHRPSPFSRGEEDSTGEKFSDWYGNQKADELARKGARDGTSSRH